MKKYIVISLAAIGLVTFAVGQTGTNVVNEVPPAPVTTNTVKVVMLQSTEGLLRKEYRVWKRAHNSALTFGQWLDAYVSGLISWHGPQAPQRISAIINSLANSTNVSDTKLDSAVDALK